jgi:hypothetical protein
LTREPSDSVRIGCLVLASPLNGEMEPFLKPHGGVPPENRLGGCNIGPAPLGIPGQPRQRLDGRA